MCSPKTVNELFQEYNILVLQIMYFKTVEQIFLMPRLVARKELFLC